jgi:ATP-binding cassette subfamily B protein
VRILFIIYVLYLTWPVASLGYTINLIQRSAASNQRLNKLLDEPVMTSEPAKENVSDEKNPHFLKFDNVSFAYPGTDVNVLENVDITIQKGSMIGIVGRTGSGKTSLVQLIPRLFDPTEGRILLNGRDIRSIELDKLRSRIGMVPQDIFLFSDTISENIAFGKEQASQEEVTDAAKRAQVLDNILSFEKKFDTLLGERGITLSGGQKQRTSLARALIRHPEILILDDSLSAVDTGTEEAILRQLLDAKQRYTTILISHRISTVKQSDYIFVLEDGKISESGTHQDLLKLQGMYYSMYQKQLLEAELLEI